MKKCKHFRFIYYGFLFLTIVLISNIFLSIKVEATEESGVGFTFNVNYPENQANDVGYFDLKMEPGQEQTVSLTLNNPGTENLKINIALNSAKTNSNGVLEFGPNEIENDKSLAFDFKDIVTGPESIEVPGGESVDLELVIKMPETTYDGAIVGGIHLQQDDSNEEESNVDGAQIKNKYAFIVGVVLRETDTPLTTSLVFNQAYADQANYRNTIFINFSNEVAEFVNDMAVEAQITQKGNDAVLYEAKKREMRMAPNTLIDFPISMNGEQMVPGQYTAKVLVTAGDYRQEWTEDFEITQEEADKFNERDVGLTQEKGIDWRLIVMIVGGVLALVVIVFVIIQVLRKKKKKKETGKRQLKKKTEQSHKLTTKKELKKSKN